MQTASEYTQGEPYPAPAVGWYATILLALLYWLSVLDRFIISLLVDPIKQDLGLTDVQFGMLQGLAFLLSFTLFGFMFGALADRVLPVAVPVGRILILVDHRAIEHAAAQRDGERQCTASAAS